MKGLSSAPRGESNPQTMREFMERMLTAFPDAEVSEDNDGQLIVYTNLYNIHDDPDDDRSSLLTTEEYFPPGSNLCDVCKVPAHDSCGRTIGCSCCDDTVARQAEGS